MTDQQKLEAFEWLRKWLVGGADAFPVDEMAKARDMAHALELWDAWLLRAMKKFPQ